MSKIRVLKYGGTSVADCNKIKKIATYLATQKEKLIVVVSAMNKTTDDLLQTIYSLNENPPKHEIDMLLSTGEQTTASLLAASLNQKNTLAISANAHTLNILTSGPHTKAKVENIDVAKIKNLLKKWDVIVVTGFQGIDQNTHEITTLGRGGSDLSACAIACSLGVDVEIYTDTTGVFSIDPRINSLARKLSKVTYDEMMEMAVKGAGVLEPRSVALAKKYNTKIYLAKTLSNEKGTYIIKEEEMMEKRIISGIGVDEDIIFVKIKNFSANYKNMNLIFELISKLNINVDMISHNEIDSVSFTCDQSEINEVMMLLKKLKEQKLDVEVTTHHNLNKVSLIGIGMNQESGVAARVFKTLAKIKANTHLITTSNISISLLVESNQTKTCANALVTEFNLAEERNV